MAVFKQLHVRHAYQTVWGQRDHDVRGGLRRHFDGHAHVLREWDAQH